MSEPIGFIGLGNMGGGMAASLARAGFRVLGHDVDRAALARAEAAGVTPVTDIRSLGAEAGILLAMLPNSPEVEDCFLGPDGILGDLAAGSLVIECSTIAPATTDRLAAACAEAGLDFMDAPVARSPIEAAIGKLLFMVGADDAVLARARPLIDAMGDTVLHCGSVGAGIRTKLVANLLSQATGQLSAEALALGLKLGLDRETLLGVLTGGLARNGYLADYWRAKVLAGDTEPGFAIALSAKDLHLAVAMAEAAGAAVPTATAARDAVTAAAETDGARDVSALLNVALRAAGMAELDGDGTGGKA